MLPGMNNVLNGGSGSRQFTISPAVSGKSTWDLNVDGPLSLVTAGSWTITPVNSFTAMVVVKAGGGEGGGNGGGFNTGATGAAGHNSTFLGMTTNAGAGGQGGGPAGGGPGAPGAPGTASGGDVNTTGGGASGGVGQAGGAGLNAGGNGGAGGYSKKSAGIFASGVVLTAIVGAGGTGASPGGTGGTGSITIT